MRKCAYNTIDTREIAVCLSDMTECIIAPSGYGGEFIRSERNHTGHNVCHGEGTMCLTLLHLGAVLTTTLQRPLYAIGPNPQLFLATVLW